MIALWLLAAHMVGDYLFQNRWHAAAKFTSARERGLHVAWYTLAFVPVAFWYADTWKATAFLASLAVLHFLTDRRRYVSNVGDVLGHRLRLARASGVPLRRVLRDVVTPPNPWETLPLMVDQTLHVLQLAILGSLFLT